MSDVGTKVPTNYAMPSRIVLFVKLFFYVCSNILWEKHILNQPTEANNFVLFNTLFSMFEITHYSRILTDLFNIVLFQGLCCTVYCILLHFLRHIRIFNNSFSIGHSFKILSKLLQEEMKSWNESDLLRYMATLNAKMMNKSILVLKDQSWIFSLFFQKNLEVSTARASATVNQL